MNKTLVVMLIVSISGCNQESKTEVVDGEDVEIQSEPIVITAIKQLESIVSTPIEIEPVNLSPIAENAIYSVTGNIISGTSLDVYGSKIYSVVDEPKSLSEYSIELGIQHQYNSWLCIELSNDYFLTGYYRQGEWSWSDLIPECSYGLGLPYTFDDVLVMYGNEEVKLGRNFELNLMREKSWTVEWLIN